MHAAAFVPALVLAFGILGIAIVSQVKLGSAFLIALGIFLFVNFTILAGLKEVGWIPAGATSPRADAHIALACLLVLAFIPTYFLKVEQEEKFWAEGKVGSRKRRQ